MKNSPVIATSEITLAGTGLGSRKKHCPLALAGGPFASFCAVCSVWKTLVADTAYSLSVHRAVISITVGPFCSV